MKRQSTVAKLSRTLCKRLIAFCDEFNCGVIVRFSGIEQGLTADELNELLTAMVATGLEIVPCIRKGWDCLIDVVSCRDMQHYMSTPFGIRSLLNNVG